MTEQWWIILGLSIGTYSIRLGGYFLGAQLPSSGPWSRALTALPGSLIAALLVVILVQGEMADWLAASIAFAIAMLTGSLPITMIAGIAAVWFLRTIL